VLRWKSQLADYNFDIKYVQGKTNYVSDALPRNPTQEVNIISKDEFVKAIKLQKNTQVVNVINNDPFLQALDNLQIPNENTNENTNDIDVLRNQILEEISQINENNNDDDNSLATIHSQESSNNQIVIVDDQNKSLNVEKYPIVIKRGDPNKSNVTKPFNIKTRITLYTAWPYSRDLEQNCVEYLKPNTTYGIYCADKNTI
jgi:hypothetical protein